MRCRSDHRLLTFCVLVYPLRFGTGLMVPLLLIVASLLVIEACLTHLSFSSFLFPPLTILTILFVTLSFHSPFPLASISRCILPRLARHPTPKPFSLHSLLIGPPSHATPLLQHSLIIALKFCTTLNFGPRLATNVHVPTPTRVRSRLYLGSAEVAYSGSLFSRRTAPVVHSPSDLAQRPG
jgi:hypothetical protein